MPWVTQRLLAAVKGLLRRIQFFCRLIKNIFPGQYEYIAYNRQLILFISVKQSYPITGLDRLLGLEEVEAVRI